MYASDFYYYNGEKISLTQVSDKYYLQTNRKIELSSLEFVQSIINSPTKITISQAIIPFNDKHRDYGYWSLISSNSELNNFSIKEDYYLSPVFQTECGEQTILSNFFYLKLKRLEDISLLRQFAEKYRFEVVGNIQSLPYWYILSCDKNSVGNALQLSNTLYETGYFAAAQPDLISGGFDCTNDGHFKHQ
jgi:hypothetical protein